MRQVHRLEEFWRMFEAFEGEFVERLYPARGLFLCYPPRGTWRRIKALATVPPLKQKNRNLESGSNINFRLEGFAHFLLLLSNVLRYYTFPPPPSIVTPQLVFWGPFRTDFALNGEGRVLPALPWDVANILFSAQIWN